MRYGIYGLATTVSLSRYTGRNHFLSDVLIGSAIGYGVGHFVYLRHHDANLDALDGAKKTTKLEKYFPRIERYTTRITELMRRLWRGISRRGNKSLIFHLPKSYSGYANSAG